MMEFSFTVPGVPVGKGRPRFVKATGRAYTPEKTASYESLIAYAASQAMRGAQPINAPIGIKVQAVFPIPASWTKKRKESAVWHTSKPDGDNILKALGDALNGIVWADDSQVARTSIAKVYGDVPGLHVFVEALGV
ncbi:endodeoxyribonuclease RusA [Novosphingobium aromaticivorans DSM 12444]|uniref:Endodeoxyribonuclease RusA n=2 Tax=Novosphingobium aromaticivorans TaxID=48935 RepID=Q2G3Y0_NOVAD|nr:endodeoxyribonuclease RusA [Novosphingobium aromaticivorans DSM 12444]SCY69443.1 Holliday junction resolvase RusA (prophage-encoded endonuclease) [Novosphingobium aromaticivorans]